MEPRDFDGFAQRVHGAFRHADPLVAHHALEETRVRAVQRMLTALGRGDLDAFLAETHADVALDIHAPSEFPWTLTARGREELRALVEHNFNTVVEQAPEVLNVVAQGDLLVLVARERGRLRGSGAGYDVHFMYEFTFRDDRISHIRELVAPTRGV